MEYRSSVIKYNVFISHIILRVERKKFSERKCLDGRGGGASLPL